MHNKLFNQMMESKTTKKQSNSVIIKMLDNGTQVPCYAHPGDAAMDIVATSVEYDPSTDNFIYHTGLHLESKKGLAALVLARSSLTNKGAYIPNSIGLIDTATYRGEILVKFKNRTPTSILKDNIALVRFNSLPWYKRIFTSYDKIRDEVEEQITWQLLAPYQVGERIAQMIVVNLPEIKIRLTDKLSETTRGEGGFGSTGCL